MQNLPPDSRRANAADQKPRLTAVPGKPQDPVFVGSEVYRRAAFGSNHPLRIVRHAAVMDMARIMGWLTDRNFRAAEPASIDKLTEFHDPGYVAALKAADASGRVEAQIRSKYCIGTLENPLFAGLFERAAMTVGGSILAASLALGGRTAFHPSGGTHHGRRDRASGFCYFNDPVFAIRTFIENGCERVLYVDLDAHHGDGVEIAFASEPRVTTVSIHEENRWPYTGSANSSRRGICNLPVPKGFNDSELDWLMRHTILPLARDWEPDALVLCCGADCLAGDPLSGMQLSNLAMWTAVLDLLALRVPTVVLGGGGYNPWTVSRYWAGLWARINGLQIPDTLPAAATELLADMESELVDDDEIEARWLSTIADEPSAGPVREAVKSVGEVAFSKAAHGVGYEGGAGHAVA